MAMSVPPGGQVNAFRNTTLLVGLLLGAPSFAQDSTGVTGELERVVGASPEEMKAYATSSVQEMKEGVKQLSKALDQAKKSGDPDRIDCVNDKLTQVRALAQVSESAQQSLESAASAGETERANHEARKIAVALKKARQLVVEGEACDAKGGARGGATKVTVEGGLTEDDGDMEPTEKDPFDFDVDPPQMSPFT